MSSDYAGLVGLIGLVLVAFFIVIYLFSRIPTPPQSGESLPEQVHRPIDAPAPKQSPPPPLTAADLLQRVESLRPSNPQWPEIVSALNPHADSTMQYLLTDLRGPHLFAPHLALNVIEEGCRRVLRTDPAADAVTALKAALESAKPFVV